MQEFIRTKGLTVCPPFGSKELASLNIERLQAAATAKFWTFGGKKKKRKRKRP